MGYSRHRIFIVSTWALVVFAGMATPASATLIRDLCEVQGARGNVVNGFGLVVGLAGTGDKNADAAQRQARMMEALGMDIADAEGLASANVAVVVATATIPPFAREGTRIDVQVSSFYDCESLEGGTLLETRLVGGPENVVYAIGQGPVSVGGFNVGAGGGTAVRQNHVTVGRIPMGAYVEREIPSTITDGERVTLLLKRPEFLTANRVREAIELELGAGTALAFGAGSVNVKIGMNGRDDLVGFIARLQAIDVLAEAPPAKVIVNERTGTIVVGGNVMIKPCQVAHGDLTVKIAVDPLVSQPGPFSLGQTVTDEAARVEVDEVDARLMPVQGTSAGDVAAALNRLKVTPRDMISIFQAIREAGALDADLEIM